MNDYRLVSQSKIIIFFRYHCEHLPGINWEIVLQSGHGSLLWKKSIQIEYEFWWSQKNQKQYLCSEFPVTMSIKISVWGRCSVHPCMQLFWGEPVSCLRYLCLFVYSSVHHILCYVFLRLVYPLLQVSLDCPLFIAPSVFYNVYRHA